VNHKEYIDSLLHQSGKFPYEKESLMKKSASTIALIAVLALFSGSGSAIAAETTPKPISAERAAYQTALAAHKAAIATYRTGATTAYAAHKSALATAKATRDAALAAATTTDAKLAARAAHKSAVATAKSVLDAALAARGAKPVAPVKPVALVKAAQ
jgi:hypothetical protein